MFAKRYLFVLLALLLVTVAMPVSVTQAQAVCSSDGTLEELQTTFVNDTNSDVTVHWLDPECVEQEGTPIPAGESLEFTTFDGHEFVFRNADGDPLLMFVATTLNADAEVSLSRTIAEGASALVMWQTINPARAERGLEPIYFSGVLYDLMAEATASTEGDFSAVSDAITALAQERNVGWQGTSEGTRSGQLASLDELVAVLTSSVQEKIDTDDDFGWLSPDVLSFAVYANEEVFSFIFSNKSQPTLAFENQETATEIVQLPEIGTITGILLANVEMNYYSFQAEEGVLYAISLASEDFDTYLHVYDAEGVEIGANDDGGEGLNSLLVFTTPASGTYTMGLDSFTTEAEGHYTVSITHTTEVILNELTTENPTVNEPLDVQEGVTYFVSLNSEAFDTYVTILDENNIEIAADDDGGEGLNSIAVFTASTTGTYTIAVSSYTDGAIGEYNVLIGAFAD